MAIERDNPATPIAGTDEMPEQEELSISIDNPDSVAIATDDGGMIIDFEPDKQNIMAEDFDSNLADYMDESTLNELGGDLISQYQADKDSRSEWEESYVKGLDQLGLKIEERTTPWAGACGVFHPMLSEAVIRFQSQSIAEMFPAQGPSVSSPEGPYLDVDSKHVFENYHNVKGVKRYGFIVDPGAASGLGGTDTKVEYDGANVPLCEECIVVDSNSNFSGIDGESSAK